MKPDGNLTPVEGAARVYEKENSARSFREDLEAHLINGYVFSTPEYFCMGRPVSKTAAHEDIVNPWVDFPRERCDAWMVYLVAGDMKAAWKCFPFPLKWIGFEKNNVLQWHDFQALAGRVAEPAEPEEPMFTFLSPNQFLAMDFKDRFEETATDFVFKAPGWDDYELDKKRVTSELKILGCVRHMAGKIWVTSSHISLFVDAAMKHLGKDKSSLWV